MYPKGRASRSFVLLLSCVIIVGLIGPLSVTPASAVGDEPPFECGPAVDGHEFIAKNFLVFRCGIVNGRWRWNVVGVYGSTSSVVYNDATYGKLVSEAGLDKEPDPLVASASVANYNPNDSHRWQPAGELRVKAIIQYWNGSSWVDCVDTGYFYNVTNETQIITGFNMQANADCGSHDYRTISRGHAYDSGLWRGGSQITAPCARSLPELSVSGGRRCSS